MDLRVLEYFLMVAKEENVSHAAQILHVSQPTISRQLMLLEEEVGQTLFIRGNKNMTLTKEGLFFKTRAEELLSLYHRTIRELSDKDKEITGEIFIGSGETDAFGVLAKVIHEFQQEYPLVRFHIVSSDSDAIKDNIDKGIIDMGFLFEPVNISKYAFARTPITEKWGILVPSGHELAGQNRVRAEELRHRNLIVPQRMSFQSEIFQWMGKETDSLTIKATYNLINNAMAMTKEGIGITLCIEMGMYQAHGLTFTPLEPAIQSRPVIVWKNHAIFSPAMEKFVEACRRSFVI